MTDSASDQAAYGTAASGNRSPTELTGTVRKVIWSDAESGAHVLAVALENGEERIAKGQVEENEVEPGMKLRFFGRYEHHHRHGEQFAWQTFTRVLPHDQSGIVKYLTDIAPHVGRITALRLWEAFQGDAERVLRNEPTRVVEAGIMSREHAEEASRALADESAYADTKIDLFTIFTGRGFPMKNLLPWLLRKWRRKSPEIVRRNPLGLILFEAPGCGWKRCDKLYRDLGLPLDALKRQAMCAWAWMREDTVGHTWHPLSDVEKVIKERIVGARVNPGGAIKLGILCGLLSRCRLGERDGKIWIAEGEKEKSEHVVREKVKALLSYPDCAWPSRKSLWGSGLSEHQFETISAALSRPVVVLAGTPGTGKTFSAAAIIRRIVATYGSGQVAVCAPTGKAAVRITDALGRYGLSDLEATTIHRRLEIGRIGHDGRGWAFLRNEQNPLPFKFVVIDESSMLDIDLAASLLRACEVGSHILIVGDPYQLPPVGHGAFLRDLISAKVPTALLNEVKRNSGMIVSGCVAIKSGLTPECSPTLNLDSPENLCLVAAHKPEQQIEALTRTIAALRAYRNSDGDKAPYDLIWDVQVITPQNRKSAVSREVVNKLLQAELNPMGQSAEPDGFRIGDKIICQTNSWPFSVVHVASASREQLREAKSNTPKNGPLEDADCYLSVGEEYVANGEQAKVTAVAKGKCIAELQSPFRRIVVHRGKVLDKEELTEAKESDFALAYAVTIHKSQGSEWPIVVVMLDEFSGFLGVRELLYTAVSRASARCVLIGKPWTLQKWCRKESLSRRNTFLADDLRPFVTELLPKEGESHVTG